MPSPEAKARQSIDRQLAVCGWRVQDRAAMKVEAQIKANLKRAARQRQAVLKRAFEGRLVGGYSN